MKHDVPVYTMGSISQAVRDEVCWDHYVMDMACVGIITSWTWLSVMFVARVCLSVDAVKVKCLELSTSQSVEI